MTAPSAARIQGLRETVKALEKYGVDVGDLKEAFGQITGLVERKAVDRVQRGETLKLVGSIRPAKSKNRAIIRAGGARVPYATRQHWSKRYGTRYLWNPATETIPTAIELIIKDLDRLAKSLNLRQGPTHD